jgi:cytochrome b pre-mRNA-processing protein 3
MMFRWLRDRVRTQRIGRAFYDSIVAQSRAEPFYRELGVPDTMEGRFELIVLHTHLVLERLRPEGDIGQALSRALIEAFVADVDANMREIGIADLGVPRRVKRAAAALFERARAYAAAQPASGTPDALQGALVEHIYGGVCTNPNLPLQMARYVRQAVASLDQQPSSALLEGRVAFPDVLWCCHET